MRLSRDLTELTTVQDPQANQPLASATVQADASRQLGVLIRGRVQYCIQHHRALDVGAALEGVMALLASLTAATGRSQARHAGRGAPDADAWQEQLLLTLELLLQTVGGCCHPL